MALLAQYLTSILRADKTQSSELPLKPGKADFNWFRIFLENQTSPKNVYQSRQLTMLYLLEGQLQLELNNKNLDLAAGNILLLQKDQSYQIKHKNNAILVKFNFAQDLKDQDLFQALISNQNDEIKIQTLIEKMGQEGCLFFKNSQVTPSSQVLQKIIDDYLNQGLFTQSLIKAQMTILLISLVRGQQLVKLEQLETAGFEENDLDKYIDNHFADITLKQTAEYFGFNPNYFSNLVKQKTGKSFVAHVDDRRMQEARFLLAQPDISLKEIVKRCGYSSKSFFYKKFNQYYGQTPAAMRQHLFREANINLLK